ncbi:hypothetical protein [Polyangium fumosum]|uniref:Uncharacterized protein n=1 Tax=Polyangium fumosum TaxID=889272 RepID=A0A4U1JEN3_9BACT|nr:hypothetical protein [Polyangium fumosum]TKD09559.1 hypothetical protein E8A74_12615 [Polyangium fumosum]
MATCYDLILFGPNNQLTVGEVRTQLLARFPLETCDDWIGMNGPGLTVTVTPHEWPDSSPTLKRRGVRVGFRHYYGREDEPDGHPLMMQIVDWLLHEFDADAHFSFDTDPDRAYLVKTKNRILLVEDEFWSSGEPLSIDLITPPYERRKVSGGFSLDVRLRDMRTHPLTVRGALVAQFHLNIHPKSMETAEDELVRFQIKRCRENEAKGYMTEDPDGEYLSIYIDANVFEYDGAIDRMLGIMHFMLRQKYAGDAKLTWWYKGPPLLERTGTTLTLLDEPDFWTPARKALFEPKP